MCLLKSYTSWHLKICKSCTHFLPVQLGLAAKIRLMLLDSISIWLSNLAMENQHFSIGNSSNNIHGPFSMAMLNNQRVCLSVQMRPVLLSMVPPPQNSGFSSCRFSNRSLSHTTTHLLTIAYLTHDLLFIEYLYALYLLPIQYSEHRPMHTLPLYYIYGVAYTLLETLYIYIYIYPLVL